MKDIRKIIVNTDMPLRDALLRLEETGAGMLLIVNSQGQLLRTVTDGDLRRMLLSDANLNQSLRSLSQKNPITVQEGASQADVLRVMDRFEINHIPVVDDNGIPLRILRRNDLVNSISVFLSPPDMGSMERYYIEEAFQSNWIAPLGPNVDAFEKEMAEYVDISHAVAMSSGTAAIHIALKLLDIQQGDRVFCSDFTFIASVNPILYEKAIPVFIESNWETWNMCPEALAQALHDAKKKNQLPKAVIVVDIYGQSADMGRIREVIEHYNIPIIQDSAESLGARYKGKAAGTFGKFGIYSFNGNKIITTSGGGMLVCDDERQAKQALHLITQAKDNKAYYYHTQMGYNYRMSNVLAGIGRGQLASLDEKVAKRRYVFEYYRQSLAELGFQFMPEPEGYYSTHWLSVAIIQHPDINPDAVIKALRDRGIESRRAWYPMHLQPLLEGFEYHTAGDRVGKAIFERGICLPSGSSLSEHALNSICEIIKSLAVARLTAYSECV